MCGITAVINGEKNWNGVQRTNDFMKQACVSGIFRGDDSTGMFQVSKGNVVKVIKDTVDGYHFLNQKRVQEALRNVDGSVATVLHHRAKTHGEVAYETCHPFEHELENGRYVIGVHNGTVGSFKRKEDGINFDVDSDWLYWRICRDGAAKALCEVGNGSYALVWMEKPSNTYFFAANKERPLHFAAIKGKNALLVASELGMLYWLASRNGFEIESPKYPGIDTIVEINPEDVRAWAVHKIDKPAPVVIDRGHLRRNERGQWAGRDGLSEHGRMGQQGFSPVVGRLVKNTDDLEVRNYYDTQRIDRMKLERNEKLVFSMSKSEPGDNSGTFNLIGVAEADDGTIYDAIITTVGATARDNIEAAWEAHCIVIGVRETIHKKTGVSSDVVILAPPSQLFQKPEDTSVVKTIGPANKTEPSKELTLVDLEAADWPRLPSGAETFVAGPRGQLIPVGEFIKHCSEGCANCTTFVTPDMASDIGWTAEKKPICSDCLTEIAQLTGTR